MASYIFRMDGPIRGQLRNTKCKIFNYLFVNFRIYLRPETDEFAPSDVN
jgi:hypothetical protein